MAAKKKTDTAYRLVARRAPERVIVELTEEDIEELILSLAWDGVYGFINDDEDVKVEKG